jgi:nitrogen fixation NifU-like protein
MRIDGIGKYNDTVMDHYRNPRNVGEVAGTTAVAQVGDAATGDVLRISLRIEAGTVVEARFKSFGCTAAIAAGSMATLLVQGRPVETAERLSNREVVEALGGLPEAKIGCSVLAEQAIREAVRRWRETAEPRAGTCH